MALTPEEEKQFRAEIRKKLEEKIQREKEAEERISDERTMLLEERIRAKIKEEEIEKYYTEKGFSKYVNRHGEVEWLSPDDSDRRKNRRRGKKSSSRANKKARQRKTVIINTSLVAAAIIVFAVLFKFNPFKAPPAGHLLVQSSIPGATIFIDGEATAHFTPDTLRNISTGRHVVTVFKDGFVSDPPVMVASVQKDVIVPLNFEIKSNNATAEVFVHVNVSGYRLFVDGLPYPIGAGGGVQLPYGYHTIMVIKDGFIGAPSYKRVLIAPGKENHIQFNLAPETEMGYLQISDNIFDGYIYLDNEFTGLKANGSVLPVRAGTYEVRVRKNGYVATPDSHFINIIPGEQKLVIFRMREVEKEYELSLRTQNSGASIFLNGEWLPLVTPVTNIPVSAGQHFINFARGEYSYAALDQRLSVSHKSNLNLSYNF